MLIIKEITHYKNFLNRKLQLPFEALNLCNLVIVKEFASLWQQNFFDKLFHKILS